MDNPFELSVYDNTFALRGYIGNPINLTVTPRFNEVGTASVVIDLDHRLAPAILADGSRLVIKKDGNFVMSGKIHQRTAEGPTANGTLTFYVKSDFRLLHQVLGWAVPGAGLASQTSEYHTLTGSAESIFKTAVTANMTTRLGLPVTCAAGLNRGAVVPDGVKLRFHPLFEKLFPAIELAGLGVTFEQSGAGIVCDVFVPPLYPHTLTEESGMLQWWSWSSSDASATRVVAGGKGEAVLRDFAQVVNTATETAYNDVHEVFADAQDAETNAILISRAQEALDELAPRSGFAVRLSETGTFRYGENGLIVGARVTISVGGVTRTDFLREVTMTYSRDSGVEVTPIVGDVQDNPDRAIASFLARLKKSISDLKASK